MSPENDELAKGVLSVCVNVCLPSEQSGWGPSSVYLRNLQRNPDSDSAWHIERARTERFTQKQTGRLQRTPSPLPRRASLSTLAKLRTEFLGQTLV